MSRRPKPLERPYSRGGSTICSKHDHLLKHCPPELRSVVEAAKIDGLNLEGALQRSQEECNNLEAALESETSGLRGLLARVKGPLELHRVHRQWAHADKQNPSTVRTRAAQDVKEVEELLQEIAKELNGPPAKEEE